MKYYNDLINEIEEKRINNIYFLVGPEEYLKEEAITKISHAFLEHVPLESEIKTYYADEIEPKEFIYQLANLLLFSSKQVVILKNLEFLEKDKRQFELWMQEIKNYISSPSPQTCLIIIISKKIGDFSNLTYEFYPLKYYEVKKRIENIMKERKKYITSNAIDLLLEKVGMNMFILMNELEKLDLLIIDKNVIDVNDVEYAVEKSIVYNVFDLTESVANKDLKNSIQILNHLFLEGEEPIKILNALIHQFRMILQVKIYYSRNLQDDEIADILQTKKFFINKLIQLSSYFSFEELKKIFEKLLEVDLELKSSSHPEFTINKLIIDLCKK
jgi:DNA polymerase-3 subunit delta